jgi:DNA-binding GntR family transcriptional regulator
MLMSEPLVKAIKKPLPLAKIALKSLRDSILSGKLVPNETYNEIALAKKLGISRTPVREALLELSSQGLITFLPRVGVRINHFTEQDVKEIFELRKAIELFAVAKVSKDFLRHDFTSLETTLQSQREAIKKENFLAFLNADREFHLTFTRLTNNKRLLTTLENIRDMIQVMSIRALAIEIRAKEVVEEHEKVIEAVKKGLSERAVQEMEKHLNLSERAVLEQWASESGK